jgi:hypothetical protein
LPLHNNLRLYIIYEITHLVIPQDSSAVNRGETHLYQKWGSR